MLTDWLRIMLDEIARKQAELESGRTEQRARESECAQQKPAAARKRRTPQREAGPRT
ncbi:MAG TPA: hypothetical protein VKB41_04330 [Steroidobacteraceae bacterium]|jgi:hypothetical protein|nr:hypothetical protein [Steroidobacteraceae bacterium]